jgi:hypothetical protein
VSRGRAARWVVASACTLTPLACADVATLNFEEASGDVDAGDGSNPSLDAFGAPDAPDAPVPEAGCPQAVPPGASVCCGSVPCNGNCGTLCSACIGVCGIATICCAKTNTVLCKPPGAACN